MLPQIWAQIAVCKKTHTFTRRMLAIAFHAAVRRWRRRTCGQLAGCRRFGITVHTLGAHKVWKHGDRIPIFSRARCSWVLATVSSEPLASAAVTPTQSIGTTMVTTTAATIVLLRDGHAHDRHDRGRVRLETKLYQTHRKNRSDRHTRKNNCNQYTNIVNLSNPRCALPIAAIWNSTVWHVAINTQPCCTIQTQNELLHWIGQV